MTMQQITHEFNRLIFSFDYAKSTGISDLMQSKSTMSSSMMTSFQQQQSLEQSGFSDF